VGRKEGTLEGAKVGSRVGVVGRNVGESVGEDELQSQGIESILETSSSRAGSAVEEVESNAPPLSQSKKTFIATDTKRIAFFVKIAAFIFERNGLDP
jgi:hypothetical protein